MMEQSLLSWPNNEEYKIEVVVKEAQQAVGKNSHMREGGHWKRDYHGCENKNEDPHSPRQKFTTPGVEMEMLQNLLSITWLWGLHSHPTNAYTHD